MLVKIVSDGVWGWGDFSY